MSFGFLVGVVLAFSDFGVCCVCALGNGFWVWGDFWCCVGNEVTGFGSSAVFGNSGFCCGDSFFVGRICFCCVDLVSFFLFKSEGKWVTFAGSSSYELLLLRVSSCE